MSNSEEKNIVADVIRDLIKRVEEFEKTNKEAQKNFEINLFNQFVDLRKDIFGSYLDLKIKYDDHLDRHTVDDKRAETDKLMRAHRQFTLNLILAGLAALVVVGFIILGLIVVFKG